MVLAPRSESLTIYWEGAYSIGDLQHRCMGVLRVPKVS